MRAAVKYLVLLARSRIFAPALSDRTGDLILDRAGATILLRN